MPLVCGLAVGSGPGSIHFSASAASAELRQVAVNFGIRSPVEVESVLLFASAEGFQEVILLPVVEPYKVVPLMSEERDDYALADNMRVLQGYPLERTGSSGGSSNWEGTFNLPTNEQIDYTYEFRKDGGRVAVHVVGNSVSTLTVTPISVEY